MRHPPRGTRREDSQPTKVGNPSERKKMMSEREHEKIFLALIEDFSEVIHKHLPKFDNNIEEETWRMLELFTDEIIQQLR